MIDFAPLEMSENLTYEERPVQILAREQRVLRNRSIPYVKVLWSNYEEREATWELEEFMRQTYPYLFETLRGMCFDVEFRGRNSLQEERM